MVSPKKIFAISGSTRAHSSNQNLIRAIAMMFAHSLEVAVYEGLSQLPHFNPDLDNEHPPASIVDLRKQITEADGILICTPEYAMGVPGSLKNAIDWTVSSCEFSHKPVALITAATSGEKAHSSLLETLRIIEADIPVSSQLLISFVKTKMSEAGEITHAETLEQIRILAQSLRSSIESRELNP